MLICLSLLTKRKTEFVAVRSCSVQNFRSPFCWSVSLCTDFVLSLCRYTLCWCARGAQSLTGTSCCGGQSAFLLREGTIPRWVSRQISFFLWLFFSDSDWGSNQGPINSYFAFCLTFSCLFSPTVLVMWCKRLILWKEIHKHILQTHQLRAREPVWVWQMQVVFSLCQSNSCNKKGISSKIESWGDIYLF